METSERWTSKRQTEDRDERIPDRGDVTGGSGVAPGSDG
jgi:hypothetical protein